MNTICELLTRGAVSPGCPRKAAWARPGDLAPLAHLALLLVGEGECHDSKGGRIAGAYALKSRRNQAAHPRGEETVSLINGTAMLAVGTLSLLAAETPGGLPPT